MKYISNKEILKKLKEYFLQQDFEDVAYALASAMIDFNRILHLDDLNEKERLSLQVRLEATSACLVDFIKNGPSGKLKIHKFNSDEL